MEQLLSDPLSRAERLFGKREAIACGETRLTYADFADRCRRLSNGLRTLGVGRGDRVATLMANCHRYLEAYFATPAMGAVLVPLNNRHAVPEHRYIMEDAGVGVLLVDGAHAEIGDQLAGSARRVVRVPDEYEALIAASEPMDYPSDLREGDLAALFYTGGTTGLSKGAMLSHRNLVANALHSAIGLGYTDADTYLHAAPMFHLADGLSTYAITWLGGRHAFVPSFEPQAVLERIETERVSCTTLVPTMITALVNHPRVQQADLDSLRMIVHGGAPISTDLLRVAIKVFGCSFTQAYGMTEAAPLVTLLRHEEQLLDDPRLRSAGREIAGVTVEVRADDGSVCPPGHIGEVVAKGPNFMQAYWNKPAETAKVLGDGWYRTGDLGYLDDEGYLFLMDRAKDMIISGGENVYSTEVEEVVSAHPDVLEVAVIGLPDDHWGERVHAIVVRKPRDGTAGNGSELNEQTLKTFCQDRLANYKRPRSVEFRDELPKSGAGKILKRELRDEYWKAQDRRVH